MMYKCIKCGGEPKLRCAIYNDVIQYYYVVCKKCGQISQHCDSFITAMQCWNGQNLTGFGGVGGDNNDER